MLHDNLKSFEIIKDCIYANDHLLPFKSYSSSKQMLNDLKNNIINPVLLIVDVEEKRFDEIAFSKKVKKLKQSIQIVFISSTRNKAVEAFKINAADYLLKPVNRERLQKTIDRL
jgi:two-component SAPR family response regulator